uniref:Salivary effector protein 2204 n=1 Tax=Schizaphis graminum TaxID=13262 RepID=A0A977R5B7_SCHGA|nr:salivary effector protein 2204 [Schizaphis graminum]
MTTITSVAALFGCILLHLFVFTSTASRMPDSDLPFEFSDKGSVITEDNVLTQSVSSDGKTVFKTNDPQPIKKYQRVENTKKSPTNQNQKQHENYRPANSAIEYYSPIPARHTSTSHYSTSPMMDNRWNFLENFSKYV